jgi:DNA-directed RNA polymerase specialized sigma24 family protein
VNYKNKNNLADQLLVDKVLHGDTSVFKAIMKNTEGLVAQIIFKMIPGVEDRKDIAQDIYLKTFQKLGSFKFQSKLSTWVAQIAYNTCINHLEKKKLILLNNYNDGEEPDGETLEKQNNGIDPFSNETENSFSKKSFQKF